MSATIAGLLFAALTATVLLHQTQGLDDSIAAWFADHRSPAVVTAADWLGVVTTPGLIAAVGLVCLLAVWRGDLRKWVIVAGATGAAFAVGWLAKFLVDRPRPLPPVNLFPEAESSYPSGHVLVLAVVVGCVVAILGRHYVPALLVVGLVCLQRLVVGAHWFTDVLASVLLAVVIVAAATLMARRMATAHRDREPGMLTAC